MKGYRVSSKPQLSQTGQFIYTKGKAIRKPVKTWKTVLKEHKKNRLIAVQERARPIPAGLIEWLKGITE